MMFFKPWLSFSGSGGYLSFFPQTEMGYSGNSQRAQINGGGKKGAVNSGGGKDFGN
jgi:hypothetical protein